MVARPPRPQPRSRIIAPLRRGLHRIARTALACGLAGSLLVAGAAEAPKEYDVKAALLYNITQFVEWPPQAFPQADAPLIIGVLGRDPFGETLDRLVANERVGSHRIVVRRFHDPAQVHGCHLLYISASERPNLGRIIASIEMQSVLTISDFEGFLDRGGMVALHRASDQKIRLRVNLDAVRASALTISAKLLRVAETVSSSAL